jgi:hypothetical protein
MYQIETFMSRDGMKEIQRITLGEGYNIDDALPWGELTPVRDFTFMAIVPQPQVVNANGVPVGFIQNMKMPIPGANTLDEAFAILDEKMKEAENKAKKPNLVVAQDTPDLKITQ